MNRFFSYSNEHGFSVHETMDKAKNEAESILMHNRIEAYDAHGSGWNVEEVESISYGILVGSSVKTHEKFKEDMDQEEIEELSIDISGFDSISEYDIEFLK